MMDIIINLINLISEKINIINNKIDDINNRHIINNVLSKLDFMPKSHYIITKDNKIFIKCHSYYSNIYFDDEIKNKIIEYNQPNIFSHIGNSCIPPSNNYNEIINNIDYYAKTGKRLSNLYLCIKYADIIIDLETNNYNIIKTYFNIRKPTNDKYKLFENIINNIDNSSYYFLIDYDLTCINEEYSDIKNNIYDLNKINLVFSNNYNNINIDVIMDSITLISKDIDTKPMVSNQIKKTIINGGFI